MTNEELEALILQVIEDLSPSGSPTPNVLGARLGAELRKRGIFEFLGARRLSAFLRESCPNILVERSATSDDIVISRKPQQIISAIPEGRMRIDWPPLMNEWLTQRYERDGNSAEIRTAADLKELAQLLENGEYSEVINILGPAVKSILEESGSTGITLTKKSLLVLCLWADAELAAGLRNWGPAVDLMLAAVEVSNDLPGLCPKPLRVTQVVAAGFLGMRALEAEPAELAQMASPALLRTLALVSARTYLVNEKISEEMLGGKSEGLYFPVRESAVNLMEESNFLKTTGRQRNKEIEYSGFKLLSQLVRTFYQESLTLRELICGASGESLEPHIAALLRHIGRHKGLLLPEEFAVWKQLEPLLGRCIGRRNIAVLPQQAINREELVAYSRVGDDLWRVADRAAQTSMFGFCLLRPVAVHVSTLLRQSLEDSSQSRRPILQLRRSRPRYPLREPGREISLRIEVMNVGQGPASNIEAELAESPPEILVPSVRMFLGSLSSGESKTCTFSLTLLSALPNLRLPVRILCQDWAGTKQIFTDEIVVASQDVDPNWEELLSRKPYSLEPVEDPARLRGRSAQLTKLQINISTQTSTIVWGQKRVGKTSVARVLFNLIADKPNILAVYLRRGEIAGYDEGAFGHHVAERIVLQARKKGTLTEHVDIPKTEEFGTHIAQLTRVIDDMHAVGFKDSIVLFSDEFDELNPGFFRGPRGENFFATLRSLTESRVVLVLIGSERMPAIFSRYHQQLNKFDTLRVDTISETADVIDMVEKPVEGYLEYDREATTMIAGLAGQNPYYVNLLCTRILQAMINERRTFIDPIDVTRAAQEIASDYAPTHWGHLWQESEAEELGERGRRERDAALVLSAFGQRGDSFLRINDITTAVKTECEGQIPRGLDFQLSLDKLVARQVLCREADSAGPRYNTTVKLFRLWLCENARSVLISGYNDRPADQATNGSASPTQTQTLRLPDFPLPDEDLVPIAEGLWYRGKPVDAMQIKNWLRQFRDDVRIVLMFRLLQEFRKRWYYDESRVAIALERAYDQALAIAKKVGVTFTFVRTSRKPAEFALFKSQYLRKEEVRGVVANVYVSYFGDALKSGAEIARRIKKEKRLANVGELSKGLRWLDDPKGLVRKEERFLMIVDDFLGSGYQFTKMAMPLIKHAIKTASVVTAFEAGRIAYIPLWAYKQGIEAIAEAFSQLRLGPVYLLDESDQVFSDQAGVFDEDERTMAESVCKHIGNQLYPDNPLGWENLQAAVVFFDSVPNATLPIIWCTGMVDERPWKPLFPR